MKDLTDSDLDLENLCARQRVLYYARREIGLGRPAVYWREVLRNPFPPYPKHWCGALVLWCLKQAKLEAARDLKWVVGWGFLGDPATRNWRLPLTRESNPPKPGDVVYFDKPFQHHALLVALDPIEPIEKNGFTHPAWKLVTIDGNQPDCRERERVHVPSLRQGATIRSISPWLPEDER